MSLSIFLSTVSDEFRSYRDALRSDLTRHNVEVKVQEDFKDFGGATLDKLDLYIAACQVVIHLAGDMTGAFPGAGEQAALRAKHPDIARKLPPLHEALEQNTRISYTQWEAWLALYHDKLLLIAKAADDSPRGPGYLATLSGKADQAAHLDRLRTMDRYPGCTFTSPDHLARHIAYSVILDELAKVHAEKPRRPRNLPFPSLGSLFKGREAFLERLHAALKAHPTGATAVVGKALHGLGGVGKTRLAVEYGWRHESEHTAVLFVRADTPEVLATSLATLAGPDILDLPEKDAQADHLKIPAALNWLEAHPGWLMILDNIDDEKAAKAAQNLLTRLRGGHVVITGRMSNFSAAVKKLELGVLALDDAAAFLLERTDGDRDAAPDDAALARALAENLGGLALGLEQAGAYIATERVSFARYRRLWREKRETVTGWFDRHLMTYDHDTGLAATWATSVDRLKPDSRRLLERLAFFAPDPIPKTLLDVARPGDESGFDATALLSGLYAYSLVAQAEVKTGKQAQPGFAVHRLVQDFTRRGMTTVRRDEALGEALEWVNAGFVGHPQDVRTWAVLDPLAAHAKTLADHDGDLTFAETTARLYGALDVLFDAKARYPEAESASRRALAIDEASYGPDHPTVAIRLNNLAELLRATNRLNEAEPLFRRAIAIDEASYGPDHPTVAIRLNNLAGLLQATNRLNEAEPLYRRAIAINETSYGPDHPQVALGLNNLAELLRATNRLNEAEPLYRRALAIDEASYGPDHPNVAIDLNNLAAVLQDTNRLNEAEPLFRRALAIDEASYGPDHPNVALRLWWLATLYQVTNRLDQAEPLLRRALAIFEASLGPKHPNTIRVRDNLAALLAQKQPPHGELD